ncbi:CBS domain containing-hemolysin-like protein [Halohasta litchfieldiae]|jgi:CBS domain containing-hemolysin-like protein|uniref:Hemolysin, contains CBS domains n=1 Tax=Halohasta litchfieldiae TaxID=1073996 RepID=A0A1H6TJA3_9EURY|nr:hemolysin family protein [Halohasta litchfieldiae]ATW88875.1 CBS domain containing-hemolysin-like protein [Halohasta litchfieldiae]SEI80139.1 Hemolysin, contains CBS domains [Halohasta litchfieldiae]
MALTVTLLGIAAIVLLTGISAFFSSSELAVFSVAKHRIDSLVASETPGSEALAALRENPHRFLVTALVSNNVANIAAASVATAVLIQYMSSGQAATGSTIVTSFFVIVFGEIAPKSYAVANAERHALRVARPVQLIQRLLRPILYVFEVATAAVNRFTGGESGIESYLSREEIETIVLSGEQTGVLATGEGAMIRSVLDLEQTVVRAVMVPRTAIVAVPSTASLETTIETCWQKGVSRLPVFGETRDDIQGVVDLQSLLRARAEGRSLSESMTEPRFVPSTKPVDELLTEMQVEGHRMVVVVDEFGTVVGLATLEDVVEEVVGEIFSHDETDPVRVVDSDTAVVNGWATVAYTNDSLGIELPTEGAFETVAGLVTHHKGRLPQEDDRVELGNVVITVVDATETRVRRVRLDWTEPHIDSVGEAAATTTPKDTDAT